MIDDLTLWGIIEEIKIECARYSAQGMSLETIGLEAEILLEQLIAKADGDIFDRSIAAHFITEELYQRYGIAITLSSLVGHQI